MSKYYCGPNILPGWMKKIFSRDFNQACKFHDEAYSEKELTRKQADKEFLNIMLNTSPDLKRKTLAYLFYFSVRAGGFLFYRK